MSQEAIAASDKPDASSEWPASADVVGMNASPLPVSPAAAPLAVLAYSGDAPRSLPRYALIGRAATLAALAMGMAFFIISRLDATYDYVEPCRAFFPLLQAFLVGFGFAFYALARRQNGRLNSTYALWLTMNMIVIAAIVIELLVIPTHYRVRWSSTISSSI